MPAKPSLVLPNGYGHGWKPDTPDHRDYDNLFRDWVDKKGLRRAITADVGLQDQYLPSVRNQGRQGACTGHAFRGCMMYSLRKKSEAYRKPGYDLSPAMAYWLGREIETTTGMDVGAELRDVLKGGVKYGMCHEQYMPYDELNWTRKPSKQAYKNGAIHQIAVSYKPCLTIDDILQALALDIPVAIGTAWFNDSDGPNGDMPMPSRSSKLDGGHAIWVHKGLVSRRRLRYQNSWTAQWGDKGYGTIPFDFMPDPTNSRAPQLMDDCWAIVHE